MAYLIGQSPLVHPYNKRTIRCLIVIGLGLIAIALGLAIAHINYEQWEGNPFDESDYKQVPRSYSGSNSGDFGTLSWE